MALLNSRSSSSSISRIWSNVLRSIISSGMIVRSSTASFCKFALPPSVPHPAKLWQWLRRNTYPLLDGDNLVFEWHFNWWHIELLTEQIGLCRRAVAMIVGISGERLIPAGRGSKTRGFLARERCLDGCRCHFAGWWSGRARKATVE